MIKFKTLLIVHTALVVAAVGMWYINWALADPAPANALVAMVPTYPIILGAIVITGVFLLHNPREAV